MIFKNMQVVAVYYKNKDKWVLRGYSKGTRKQFGTDIKDEIVKDKYRNIINCGITDPPGEKGINGNCISL